MVIKCVDTYIQMRFQRDFEFQYGMFSQRQNKNNFKRHLFCICLECLLWSVCKSQNTTQLPDLILLEFGIAISGLVFK